MKKWGAERDLCSLEDSMSLCEAQSVCGSVFMIPSTQCELCLFFMSLGAHDLITLSARRKERDEHLKCLY